MDPLLNVPEGDLARFRAAPSDADLAALGPSLRDPLFTKYLRERRDDWDDAPRATRFPTLLVGGKLEGGEIPEDVRPVQDADLLVPGGAVGR
jgi:hypothetical protein